MIPLSPTFMEHASLAAIDQQIAEDRAARDQWNHRMLRLEDLRLRREAQIDAGTWPATEATESETKEHAT